jgi:sporulation protein YqfD
MKKGLLRVKYKISGSKLRFLPTFLNGRGISVYEYKEIDLTRAHVIIDFSDSNKFFAICKNMCYNKTIIGFYGVLAPIALLVKHLGVVLGVLAFTFIAYLLNGVLLEIDCVGTGGCFSAQTQAVISDYGVKKYTLFKDIDFDGLEAEILKTNPKLSFVSLKKQGNKLIVDSVLSDKDPDVLGENYGDLVSGYDGIIESIKVLRGTALVSVGDSVTKDSVLVGAYLLGKEDKTYPTYVLATITIISEEQRFIKVDSEITDALLKSAEKVAEFEADGEVICAKAEKTNGGIIINLKLRHTVSAVY